MGGSILPNLIAINGEEAKCLGGSHYLFYMVLNGIIQEFCSISGFESQMKRRERKKLELIGLLFYAFILGYLNCFFIVFIIIEHQLGVRNCIRLGDTIQK